MLQPGHIYIAPGTKHLTLKNRQACWRCWLNDDERVSGHKPSVDVLFSSIAKYESSDVLGVILTGMGKDGANGLHQLNWQVLAPSPKMNKQVLYGACRVRRSNAVVLIKCFR